MTPESINPVTPSTPPVEPARHSLWKGILEWIWVIVVAILVAQVVRAFIVEPFIVVGSSMDPTFATGQFLIVDRLSYRFHDPARGDVIVLKNPNDTSTDFIKRIIGLPGETLDIKNGVVSVHLGSTTPVTLDEPYVDPAHRSHDTMHITLRGDEYFLMGDNRAYSSDSRLWGPLPRALIIGRPIVRLFPLGTFSFIPGKTSYSWPSTTNSK